MEKSTDDTKGGEMPLSQGTKEAKPGIYGVLCVCLCIIRKAIATRMQKI